MKLEDQIKPFIKITVIHDNLDVLGKLAEQMRVRGQGKENLPALLTLCWRIILAIGHLDCDWWESLSLVCESQGIKVDLNSPSATIADDLKKLGFKAEDRDVTPHVTVRHIGLPFPPPALFFGITEPTRFEFKKYGAHGGTFSEKSSW